MAAMSPGGAQPLSLATPPAPDLPDAIGPQPHAAAVLRAALAADGVASHAYLFHGPPGSGKRAAARAFATALLADGAADPANVAARVAREVHPDLAWVRPSGAAEMLVSDVDEAVVAAASRTPFEARRRVFVIEGADVLNERAANRLLKTLEEPASFVCLLLLATRRADVLETIVSRCQPVRFDAAAPALIERRLIERAAVTAARAAACARLCLGDQRLADRLAGEDGAALRASAEDLARAVLGEVALAGARPWAGLLEAAKQAGDLAGQQTAAAFQADAELLGASERRRREREGVEAAKRASRRARTRALDLGLRLLELWLRDLLCVREGAPAVVHAVDRVEQLTAAAAALQASSLRRAVELVGETRLRLAQNVSEELALEAMAHRLRAAFAG